MTSRRGASALAAPLALIVAAPASAEVTQSDARGFVVHETVEVTATPVDAWKELLAVADWWNGEHTYSGDAANLSLDARPGGCFCETLPGEHAADAARGGVEHMRVLYVERPRALRLSGALGPLQGEALVGTMTIQIKPVGGGGARLLLEYVVGGFLRRPSAAVAGAVDTMLAEQVGRLGDKLGRRTGATAPASSEPGIAPEAAPPVAKPAGPPGTPIIGR